LSDNLDFYGSDVNILRNVIEYLYQLN